MEAFRVYCHLARRANDCNQAWPSYRTIGEKCFKGSYPDSKPESLRRKAIAAVKELIDWNLVSVEPRPNSNGGQASNLYCLTDETEWKKSINTPSENARKSREYQSRNKKGSDRGSLPGDGGSPGGVVMGVHPPGDGSSLPGDGGSPKGYPLKVNPIEVSPLSPPTPPRESEEVRAVKFEAIELINLPGESKGSKQACGEKPIDSKVQNLPITPLTTFADIQELQLLMDGLPPYRFESGPNGIEPDFIEHIRQWLIEIRKKEVPASDARTYITRREPGAHLQIEWPTVLQKAAEWQDRARVINQTTNNRQQQSTVPNFPVIPRASHEKWVEEYLVDGEKAFKTKHPWCEEWLRHLENCLPALLKKLNRESERIR